MTDKTPLEIAREALAVEWAVLTPDQRRQRIEARETQDAAQKAEREKAKRVVDTGKSIVLAGVTPDRASALVKELEAAIHGEPMVLSKVCEVLRAHGLALGEGAQWPDSFTQPKGKGSK